MTKYPHVQAKAQAEIDRVIGQDRLPEVSDRESLPYVNAVMQEVFRWHPTIPMSELNRGLRLTTFELMEIVVPHSVTEDDEYRGYFVPAGTVVIANMWYERPSVLCIMPITRLYSRAVLHDQETYHDPESFIPERFLKGAPSSLDIAFGFGRR